MPLIKFDHISKYYGKSDCKVTALSDISFTVESGEFTAVSGSSGSGKSTLMNMLGCLDVWSEGEYYLNDIPVSTLGEKELSDIRSRKIGFIFQSFNLIPCLTAEENVELPLIYRKIPKCRRREMVKNALEMVSLGHRAKHKPSEMSGGQQQRVAIARAIAASPPIILADEPTGNLDSRCGKEIMDILFEMNRSGKTIIIITHDDKIAASVPRVIKISDGMLISDGR